VNKEFIALNKLEESNEDLHVTPFFKNLDDVKNCAKQETMFLKYVVIPLFYQLDTFLNHQL
jgi:hypothetical protein